MSVNFIHVVLGASILIPLAGCSFTGGHNPFLEKESEGKRHASRQGQPLLEVMSLSLETFGAKSVAADGSVHVVAAPQAQFSASEGPPSFLEEEISKRWNAPLLSLMSTNLNTWGNHSEDTSPLISDSAVQRAIDIKNVPFNPLAQVLPLESNLFDPRGFQPQPMNFAVEPIYENRLFYAGAIIAALVIILCCTTCYLCCEAHSISSPEPRQTLDEEDEEFQDHFDGSWAQVYREARGEQREALELLFRCNIISTDEFAFSSATPEHIQECVWIATHMLRQKPLEEWVALWQQAQQTFEDSVTACFEARGLPPSSSSELPIPTGPTTLVPVTLTQGEAKREGTSSSSGHNATSTEEDEEEDDKMNTQHSTLARKKTAPGAKGDAPGCPDEEQDSEPELTSRTPLPASQTSQNTASSDQSRWSIESELNRGLAQHSSPSSKPQ